MSEDNGRQNALAWFASIIEMIDALRAAEKRAETEGDETEACRRTIEESVLSVEVRSGWYWYTLADYENRRDKPAEFNILLSTGGPSLRLIGELNEHGEPKSARLEHQDWGTPWTEVDEIEMAEALVAPATHLDGEPHESVRQQERAQAYLLAFARCFYFGEG